MLSNSDVDRCMEVSRRVESVEAMAFETETGAGTVIVAGSWFSVTFRLRDQYGTPLTDVSKEYAHIAIDEKNQQGIEIYYL